MAKMIDGLRVIAAEKKMCRERNMQICIQTGSLTYIQMSRLIKKKEIIVHKYKERERHGKICSKFSMIEF